MTAITSNPCNPSRTVVAIAACLALAACAGMEGDSAGSSAGGSSGSGSGPGSAFRDSGADPGSSRGSTRDKRGTTDSPSNSGSSDSSGSSGSGSSNSSDPRRDGGGMAANSGGTAMDAGGAAAMPAWRGQVQSIEPMTRQQAGIGVGGSTGAAAVGGVMPGVSGGSGAPTDRVYRVTLQTEDGGMRSVVVDTPPDYQVGDRVTYSNGMFQRQ
jgi:hypothetical protein